MSKKRTSEAATSSNQAPADNLSLDIGNAYTNVQSAGQPIDFRSIMAPLSVSNRIGDWQTKYVEDILCYQGQWWAVGDPCYVLSPDRIEESATVNRYISGWYKTLFAACLHKVFYKRVGQEVVYPRIVSSIPAGLFKNQAEVQAVKQNLAGDYEIGNTFGGTLHAMVTERQIVFLPEGVGTYFSYLFRPGGGSQYESGTWMVADAGYLTLDCVLINNGDYVADAAHSDEKTGLSIVAEALHDLVFTKARVRLGRPAIDKGMECDTITANQKVVNVVQARTDALEGLGKRATLLLEQWSAGQNLTGIILTGGGADYLHPYIQSDVLPPIVLAQHPRRANCEGGYLYLVS